MASIKPIRDLLALLLTLFLLLALIGMFTVVRFFEQFSDQDQAAAAVVVTDD